MATKNEKVTYVRPGPKPGSGYVQFGGEEVYVHFGWDQVTMLEHDRLEMEVIQYLGAGKSAQKFLQEAIFCGAVKNDKTMTPKRAGKLLSGFVGELTDLQKEVLYLIARGKPEKEAMRLIRILDESFDEAEAEIPDVEPPKTRPTSAGTGSTGA